MEEDDDDEEYYMPEFLKKPKSQHVDEGNSAIFVARIGGNPMPTVHWEKDGKIMNDGGRFNVSSSSMD